MIESLKKRVVPGLTFGGLIVAAIFFSQWSYAVLMMASIIACSLEFARIVKPLRDPNDKFLNTHTYFSTALNLLMFALVFLVQTDIIPDTWAIAVAFYFLVILAYEMFSESKSPLVNIGLNITSVLYIGMPIAASTGMVFIKGKYEWVFLLGCMLLVMMNDVGAYFAGSLFGKHKLFERISPKKTIEGTVGGFITNVLVAWLFYTILPADPSLKVSIADWIVLGLLASTGAVIGDLVESLFKRSLQIKDTGDAIPGHGGFLDRFDAILYSLPLLTGYILLRFGA